MKRVKDILEVKGYAVWSIEPGASVYDAMKLMADKEVGALMVMEGSKLVGIRERLCAEGHSPGTFFEKHAG